VSLHRPCRGDEETPGLPQPASKSFLQSFFSKKRPLPSLSAYLLGVAMPCHEQNDQPARVFARQSGLLRNPAAMARRMQDLRRQPVGWRAQKRWPHAKEEAARD
jgi:hypothetical protein